MRTIFFEYDYNLNQNSGSFLSSTEADLQTWLKGQPAVAQRIVVPAALKWEIRDKLDQANITERTLFPDLGGLSQWLRRYYRARDGIGPPEKRTPEDERNNQS